MSKQKTWTFDPPEDIERMVTRAIHDIVGPGESHHGMRTRILVKALRKGLAQYAKKKDEAQQGK